MTRSTAARASSHRWQSGLPYRISVGTNGTLGAVEHLELIVFGLLVGAAALAVLARALNVPYPIILVLGGAGIGFVPGVPELTLEPDVVLLIFLPPLLYGAAFFT